jgi:acyl-CoA reductase-like NAD-dependent aldehyde dehydrogenase
MKFPNSVFEGGGEYSVVNPATATVLTQVRLADVGETDAAIQRAHNAFPAWKAIAPGERARLLRAFAATVEAHIDELAWLEVANSGHTIGNARWEAGNVRDVLNYYSAAPERHFGRQIPVAGGIDITFYEPLGVVGIIVPWNFPMPIAGWGFAPALAAGNTVVLKPAEMTPLTALRIAELAVEAGLPEDVFTVIPGKGAVVGDRFVTHPLVRKVVFTGSTSVGKGIMRGCADQVKRLTLELGGKSANIIFDDADLERAAAAAPGGAFDNAGQDCCARSRILVQESVYQRFLELLEPAVKEFAVLDPTSPDAQMGPLISAKQRDSVAAYLAGADVAYTGASGPAR